MNSIMDYGGYTIAGAPKAAPSQEAGNVKDDAQNVPTHTKEPDPPARKPKRTTGLRIFDLVLYPLIANIGVFVISVIATYLTTKGSLTTFGRSLKLEKDAVTHKLRYEPLAEGEKLVHGRVGKFFHSRGEWLMNKFESMGMSHDSADMSKMVFFSFADGSIMAPVIKLFEDRRKWIARWCDKKLGTQPKDDRAYEAEPDQSWTSVLGGRAATAAIVVTTAVALDKKGLNDKWFRAPGIKLGEWIKKSPRLTAMFGKYEVGELARVSLFEAFYTSVCTAGLYFSSRIFARGLNKHAEQKEAKQAMKYLAKHEASANEPHEHDHIASPASATRWSDSPALQPSSVITTITGKGDAANAARTVRPVVGEVTAKIAKDRSSANEAHAMGVA